MDNAFKDPMYKEARELINSGKTIRIFVEDVINYEKLLNIRYANSSYRRNSFNQIIDTLDDLKIFCKYIDRIGMTIVKIDIID